MEWRYLIRPEYGEKFKVRPRRWWSPQERKTARLAAKLCDYHADKIQKEVTERTVYAAVHGLPVGWPYYPPEKFPMGPPPSKG